MQAAEMQIKTENSVEAASTILRTLRHAVPVLLALLIALLAAAPVLADETDEATPISPDSKASYISAKTR